MEIVTWAKDESAAVISMNNSENRHNLDFANAMIKAMDEILLDKEIKSLIITSSDLKNFSQGVDLKWLLDKQQKNDLQAMKDFMYRMNDLFKKILLYPMPVIAAINGHVYANGAIFSCACDFRFMRSDSGFFCFPEVDISIPFLPGMIAWVKKAMPEHLFYDLKLSGRRVTAKELEQFGVIKKSCGSLEELMTESKAFAKSFQKKRGIFGEMKKRIHKNIINIIEKEDPEFIDSLFLMVQE
jgi:enoyl-CoA hydratase/carnithine racemase